jgi:hypothetical protein
VLRERYGLELGQGLRILHSTYPMPLTTTNTHTTNTITTVTTILTLSLPGRGMVCTTSLLIHALIHALSVSGMGPSVWVDSPPYSHATLLGGGALYALKINMVLSWSVCIPCKVIETP